MIHFMTRIDRGENMSETNSNMEKISKWLTVDNVKATMENIQRYFLGNKKDGSPRAIYDIVKDYTEPKKKHKKKKAADDNNTYSLYLKSKKKKKKKKNKHWHI